MLNQIQDLMPETEGKKIKFVGNLKIDINFAGEVGYNQKINIEYPKDATDLMQLFGAFMGMAMSGQNTNFGDLGDNAITAPPVPGVPQ